MVCIEHVLAVLLFIALICDLRTDKVPNKLIVTGYVLGAVGLVFKHGPVGALWCVLLVAAVWLCLMPAYVCGGLGGGDCKLLAWIVLFLEKEQQLECYFLVFACAAVVAVLKLFITGRRTFHFTIAAFMGVLLCIARTYLRRTGG